ncbi:MAG: hypothetical protein IIT58_02700 [Treponema sp.]|nr:hypothetical protein [Treponema sp.]
MTKEQMIVYVIKLVMGGLTAFTAILLWSKTKDMAWMSLVIGAITSYIGLVFNMLVDLGVLVSLGVCIPGTELPWLTVAFTVVPSLFFIFAFILMLIRSK